MDRVSAERRLEEAVAGRRAAETTEQWIVFRAHEVHLRGVLDEARFDERLHPRGRGGRWIEKLGDFVRGKGTVLGTTPYLQRRDDGGPRRSFASAAALHRDPSMRPLFDRFERDAELLARRHNVRLLRGERNVGVFEGLYEPSYALKVRGAKADVDAFNRALGSRYDQKAVVGFTPDETGSDVELRVSGGRNPDAFFKALVEVMGEDAGASFDDGVWRVFVYDGNGEAGRGTYARVRALADTLGLRTQAVMGGGDYFQLREGEG